MLSRSGGNPLQSSAAGPYLNTVSFCLLKPRLHWCHFHLTIFRHEHSFHLALLYYSTITSHVCLNLFFCLKFTRLFTVFALFIVLCVVFVFVCVSWERLLAMCMHVHVGIWGLHVLGRCPSPQSIWHRQLSEWRKREKQRRLKTRKRPRGRWEGERKIRSSNMKEKATSSITLSLRV